LVLWGRGRHGANGVKMLLHYYIITFYLTVMVRVGDAVGPAAGAHEPGAAVAVGGRAGATARS
jgi:hypothetical protein